MTLATPRRAPPRRASIEMVSPLRPGTRVDLIGASTTSMRESDDHCVAIADVYIDTREAMNEAGDLIQPIKAGMTDENHIKAALSDLCAGRPEGRRSEHAITLFKVVGTALANL
jgi:ornithine cyclodeaminase/alanine dehydrogenase-like protein (mu-crystallin family)